MFQNQDFSILPQDYNLVLFIEIEYFTGIVKNTTIKTR